MSFLDDSGVETLTTLLKEKCLNTFYPVGSYYETSDTTFDPNTAWGGTWLLDSAGKVTVALDSTDADFDTVGETGGSKGIQAHIHAFTQPTVSGGAVTSGITGGAHTHPVLYRSDASVGGSRDRLGQTSDHKGSRGGAATSTSHTHNLPAHTHSVSGGAVGAVSGLPTGQSTGDSGNLQPYIVVNRWHRTE
jgi:hypothetical protein